MLNGQKVLLAPASLALYVLVICVLVICVLVICVHVICSLYFSHNLSHVADIVAADSGHFIAESLGIQNA